MKQIDKIKAMNIEEMAEYLSKIECNENCTKPWNCDECVDNYKQWLESESEG